MYHEVSHIVSFKIFSIKGKENNLHRKYRLLVPIGGPAVNLSSTI